MKVNGQVTEWNEDSGTVLALLCARGLDPARVAVERNGRIVPRAEFGSTDLKEDDRLEIVAFVGGG